MYYRPISTTIELEKERATVLAQQIIQDEMKLKVNRKTFSYQEFRYPIAITFFIDERDIQKPTLGYFDPQRLLISLNYSYYKVLDETKRKNLIRHELAHYFAFILLGPSSLIHDVYYRDLCRSFGWGEEVFQSTAETEALTKVAELYKKSKKIEKLLALANYNSNWQEAQSALLKAQALMSLTAGQRDNTDEEEQYVMLSLLEGKRVTPKIRALAQLLEFFGAQSIFINYSGGFILECVCSKDKMESIFEIRDYFSQSLEQWYREAKKYQTSVQPHSFYQGIIAGFNEKVRQTEADFFPHQKAIVNMSRKKLAYYFCLAYPRTSAKGFNHQHNHSSFASGKAMGKRVELQHKVSIKTRLLDFIGL